MSLHTRGWWTTINHLVAPQGKASDLEAEQREKSDLEQRQVGFHCVAPLQDVGLRLFKQGTQDWTLWFNLRSWFLVVLRHVHWYLGICTARHPGLYFRPSLVPKARHGASVTAHDSLKEMGLLWSHAPLSPSMSQCVSACCRDVGAINRYQLSFCLVWRRRMLNSPRSFRSGSSVGANVPISAMWSPTTFTTCNVNMGQRSRIS